MHSLWTKRLRKITASTRLNGLGSAHARESDSSHYLWRLSLSQWTMCFSDVPPRDTVLFVLEMCPVKYMDRSVTVPHVSHMGAWTDLTEAFKEKFPQGTNVSARAWHPSSAVSCGREAPAVTDSTRETPRGNGFRKPWKVSNTPPAEQSQFFLSPHPLQPRGNEVVTRCCRLYTYISLVPPFLFATVKFVSLNRQWGELEGGRCLDNRNLFIYRGVSGSTSATGVPSIKLVSCL